MNNQNTLYTETEKTVSELFQSIKAAGLEHKSLNQSDAWETIGEAIKILIENGHEEYEQFESVADDLIIAGENWES